jgi:hypothetical protein
MEQEIRSSGIREAVEFGGRIAAAIGVNSTAPQEIPLDLLSPVNNGLRKVRSV